MKMMDSLRKHWVRWVWKHTPNCAEMSRLASKSFDGPQPLGTRLRMRLHSVLCVWCKRYRKHLRFLRTAAPGLDDHLDLPGGGRLSPEAKRRILRRLEME